MFGGRGMIDDVQAGGLNIFETASVRWLNVEEIITLLSTPGAMQMSMTPPASPPSSGTLLLFDRSLVRNYKADGHEWIKKRNNPNKVREDHVKLRYKGQYRVAGTYVHSLHVSTMHRRAYRLITDPNSAKPTLFLGQDIPPTENTELVLVHYLDTLEAVRVSALYADHLAAAASSKQYQASSASSAGHPQQISFVQQQQQQQQQQRQMQQQMQQQMQMEDEKGEEERLMASLKAATTGGIGGGHDRGESLDEGALDILWDMVLEEGGDEIEQDIQNAAASAIEEHMSPGLEAQLVNSVEEALQDVAASTLSERLTAVSDDDIRNVVDQVLNEQSGGDNALADIESKVVATVEEQLPDGLQERLVEAMQTELDNNEEGGHMEGEETAVSGVPPLPAFAEHVSAQPPKPVAQLDAVPQTPLPEVIDFTPEDSFLRTDRPVKMVISTSAPIPILPPDDPPYRWHVIAAFVDIGKSAEFANNNWKITENPMEENQPQNLPFSPDPLIMKVAMAEVTKITPYSYKCIVPRDISSAGQRAIILTGIRYVDNEGGPLWDAIRVAVKVCIQAEWNVASDLTNPEKKERIEGPDLIRPKFFAPAGSGNVQLLSQLSMESFEFTEIPAVSAVPAGMMSGGHSSASMKSSEARTKSDGSANSTSGLPAPAPAMAVVASALTQFEDNPPAKALGDQIPAASSRKRALTVDDSNTDCLVHDANESAANWVSSVVPNSDGMTQGEDVDRHCKIRFVERLANVIVGAEDAAKAEASSLIPKAAANAAESETGYVDPGLLLSVDGDMKLNDVSTEELDTLLQSVLIRFVESMVDTSTSEEEVKEALNEPGFSGFTLLHYAALYNILSLIPLLLSRGADPDLPTTKGSLTPLHLAAGAGHDQIVDALVRNGCRLAPQDSFGLTPGDHALRNGFNEIAEWLKDKCRARGEVGRNAPEGAAMPAIGEVTRWTLEGQSEKGEMMQSAFKELSLKDKLGLNLFVQRYRREDSNSVDMDGGASASAAAVENAGKDNSDSGDIDFNFISEKDRESLKTAMSMMSKEELQELEKNAPYSNVRDWMLRSNYESLRDASLQLEKQAKRRALSAAKGKGTSSSSRGESRGDSGQKSGSSKKFGHSKLSQVLAMLVLRKNLLESSEPSNQGQLHEKERGGDGDGTSGKDMES